jgi:hypothetical protein
MTNPSNYNEFQETLVHDSPAANWPVGLQALWWDAKGDWHKAHELVDGSNAIHADWIHAYLHRKEGDRWNAGYWYRRAGKPHSDLSLDEELHQLVMSIIAA